MLKRNVVALAVSSLWVFPGCSSIWLTDPAGDPAAARIPARAGTVEGVLAVRDSRGVDSEGMYRIGRQFQGQGRYDEAIVAYRKAVALDAANVEARNALAVAYAAKGMAPEAEREFKAAIAIAPARSHLHGNLGYFYLQLGRTDEAVAALGEALRLDPGNARAKSNLAAVPAKAAPQVAQAPAEPVAAPSPVVAEAKAVTLPAPLAAQPLQDPAPIVPPVAAVAQAPAVPPTPVAQAAQPAPQPAARAEPLAAAVPAQPPVPEVQPLVERVQPPVVAEVAPPAIAAAPAPVASIAQLIGETPRANAAVLVAVVPNVWELRPPLARMTPPPVVPRTLAAPGEQTYPLDAAYLIARFEIANGNGVTGLARRLGEYLRTLGLAAPRLTNQKPFDQRRTIIQYVAGMEGAAEDLRLTLGSPADLVRTPRIDRHAQLRVVLGRDFRENEFVARMRHAPLKQVAIVTGAPAR